MYYVLAAVGLLRFAPLRVRERTLGDGVVSLIGDRKALLLLDNLEQVVPAAPEVEPLALPPAE